MDDDAELRMECVRLFAGIAASYSGDEFLFILDQIYRWVKEGSVPEDEAGSDEEIGD